MDVSRYDTLVHYNGNWYEIKRKRARTGKRSPVYIWQGTFEGGGYKRVSWKSPFDRVRPRPDHTCEASLVSISGSGLRCRICDRPILP